MSEGTNIASERACDRARTHKNWNQMHDLKPGNNGLENTFCAFFKLYYAKDCLYHHFLSRLEQYLLLFLTQKLQNDPNLNPWHPPWCWLPHIFFSLVLAVYVVGGKYQEKPRQTFYKTWTRQTCIPREIIIVKNQYVHVTKERTITNIHFMIPRWYLVYQNNYMTLRVDFTWAFYMLYLFFSLVSAENFKHKINIAAHFQTVLLRELNVTNIHKCGDDSYVHIFIV